MSQLLTVPLHLLYLDGLVLLAWIPGLVWVRAAQRWWMCVPCVESRRDGAHLHGGMSWLVQIAVAPAVTFGFLTVAAVMMSPSASWQLGSLTWRRPTVMAYLAVVTVLGCLLAVLVRGRCASWMRTSGDRTCRFAQLGNSWRNACLVVVAVIVGIVVAVAPLLTYDLRYPLQQWDPSFHANSVWVVLKTHDASPLGGLSPMYGHSARGVFYPSIWHAYVALIARVDTIIPVINMSSVALIIWWVIGVAALAHTVWGSQSRTVWAAILAGCTMSFPADFVSAYAQWPNATSMALTPGLVAALMTLGRYWIGTPQTVRQMGRLLLPTMVVLAGCVGGVGVHPITFFNVLVIVAVMLAGGIAAMLRRLVRQRLWGNVAVMCGLITVGVAVLAVILSRPTLTATASFQRSTSWVNALVKPFAPFPPFPPTVGLVMATATMTVMTFIGLVEVTRRRDGFSTGRGMSARWLAPTWLLCAVLVSVAYAPDFGLKVLSGPWYCDPRRLMAVMQVVIVLVSVVGLDAVQRKWRWCGRSWSTVAVAGVVLVATLCGGVDSRWLALRKVYDPDALGPAGMATRAELDLIRRSGDLLDEDAVVLGDPANGTVYFESMADRRVLFPQLALVDEDPAAVVLAQRFNEIGDNPAVCAAVRREGITHVWLKPDSHYYSRWRSERYPGLYEVDTSVGFIPLATAGQATLYRLTACD